MMEEDEVVQLTEKKSVRRILYEFFEEPESSLCARSYTLFITILIFLSVCILLVQSLDFFTDPSDGGTKYYYLWLSMEGIIAVIFTIEYIARALIIIKSCGTLYGFVFSIGNVIDVLSFLPFYFEITFAFVFGWNQHHFGYLAVFRCLRMFRMFRVFKMFGNIEAILAAMRKSLGILTAYTVVLMIWITLFSTIIYFFEKGEFDPNTGKMVIDGTVTKYTSIPKSMYFSVIAISTCGFGDMVPLTIPGQIFTCIMVLTGLSIIWMPSLIIGNEYERKEEKIREEKKEKKEKEDSTNNEGGEEEDNNNEQEEQELRNILLEGEEQQQQEEEEEEEMGTSNINIEMEEFRTNKRTKNDDGGDKNRDKKMEEILMMLRRLMEETSEIKSKLEVLERDREINIEEKD